MSQSEDFAQALSREALSEMAEHWFSARRELDEIVELFMLRAEGVRAKGRAAMSKAAVLRAFLLDEATYAKFWVMLDVEPCFSFDDHLIDGSRILFPLPRRFSRKWVFADLAVELYLRCRNAFHEYLEGRVYTDLNFKGRKVRSMDFHLLKAWCVEVNEKIAKVNHTHAPSITLMTAKSFNVAENERENIFGAGLDGLAQSLDESLGVPPLDFDSLGIVELPELPPVDEVGDEIRMFALDLFRDRKDELEAALAKLVRP